MSREIIVEGLRDELARNEEELTRLESALKHVSKVPDGEEVVGTTPTKRGRGRPKGSKNRPKTEIAAERMQKTTGKKRGRPKGSKNKPKLTPVATVDASIPTEEITTVSQPPEISLAADMPMIDTTPLTEESVVVSMPSELMEISVGGPLDDPQPVE